LLLALLPWCAWLNSASGEAESQGPLYEELLSEEGPGLIREGVLLWADRCYVPVCRPFCTRYAIPIDTEQAFREYTQHKIIILGAGVIMGPAYGIPEMAKKYNVGLMPYGPGTKRFFYEDRRQTWHNGILDLAQKANVWAVFHGDEAREFQVKMNPRLYGQEPGYRDWTSRLKYLKTVIDPDVKKTFGYGKYGVPQSSKDGDPLRWIAYFRYLNDRMADHYERLRDDVRKIAAHVRIVSEDPTGICHPYEWSTHADRNCADIYTHQTSPRSIGYLTKLLADLTGKEIWPLLHFEHYFGSYTPEQIREMFSVAYRNGATGFILYPSDSTAARENVVSMTLSAPERWNACLEIMDRVRKQAKLKFPTPDFGIFFSNAATQAFSPFLSQHYHECQNAHALLGPEGCKGWFRFVDENVILNHRGALDGFKALMIPDAKYQLPEIPPALKAYVECGGGLVCFDPEGFSFAADGSSLEEFRKQMFGVELGEAMKDAESVKAVDGAFFGMGADAVLPVAGPARALNASGGAKVLARFADEAPAVVSHKVGEGRAVFFGFNLLKGKPTDLPAWRTAFRGMATSLGIQLDQDIWRFTFPPFKTKLYPVDPEGVCLTDNYFRFENDKPRYLSNLDTKGVYRLSPSPDAVSDEGLTEQPDATDELDLEMQEGQEIPFSQGDLTDRKNAYRYNHLNQDKKDTDNWRTIWEDRQPVTITFDFRKTYPLARVRVFYGGLTRLFKGPTAKLPRQMPRFAVQVSDDDDEWKTVSEPGACPDTDGINMVVCEWKPSQARYLRLAFDRRDPGKGLELVEIEVWAEGQR